MNFTKGLPCPCCDRTARFQGGSFGGLITSTNIKCDCGFSALVAVYRDGYRFLMSAEPEDEKKANPYKKEDKDKLIIEKHYLQQAMDKTENRVLIDSLRKALRFIDNILGEL